MSSRSCPDWPQLMELAPELQFKHYTVREAQLPGDALVGIEAIDLDAVAICCDLAATSSTPSTPSPRSPRRSAPRTGSTCANGSSARSRLADAA